MPRARSTAAYVTGAFAVAVYAAAFTGACGDDTSLPTAAAADAGSDTGDEADPGDEGGLSFDSAGFDAGNMFGCQGGCGAGQYCVGTIIYPSHVPLVDAGDAGDAEAPAPTDGFACRDVPGACASDARCACLVDAGVAGSVCRDLSVRCVDSDGGGTSTVTCTSGGK